MDKVKNLDFLGERGLPAAADCEGPQEDCFPQNKEK